MNQLDPKTQVATQLGLLIIANIEQSALIAQLQAKLQEQPAAPLQPPVPTMGKQE